MQKLVCFVTANETLGKVRDFANARSAASPVMVRGVGAMLDLRLFADSDGVEPYPVSQLQQLASWQWIMDTDWTGDTTPKIVADNANITVGEVTEEINGTDYTYTRILIPLNETNTEEVYTALDGKESLPGLNGQLIGFNSSGEPEFILQIKNFTIRNRIDAAGTPTEIPAECLNEAQVRALISSAAPQVSENNTWIVNGVDTGIPLTGGGVTESEVETIAARVAGEVVPAAAKSVAKKYAIIFG